MSRIALIGLDGSGKSANLSIMKEDESYRGYKFLWVRWSPVLLKPIYLIMNRKVNSDVSSKDGDEQERSELNQSYEIKANAKKKIFRNPVVRAVWMFLATVDYFFQYHIKTFKWNITNQNVVYDRFFLDLYLDQGISFGYSPMQIRNLIHRNQWLFPRVEKYVYIRVSPEVCYARKDDIPNLDYLQKRYAVYEILAKEKNWYIVDGEQDLDKVNSDIKKIILGAEE